MHLYCETEVKWKKKGQGFEPEKNRKSVQDLCWFAHDTQTSAHGSCACVALHSISAQRGRGGASSRYCCLLMWTEGRGERGAVPHLKGGTSRPVPPQDRRKPALAPERPHSYPKWCGEGRYPPARPFPRAVSGRPPPPHLNSCSVPKKDLRHRVLKSRKSREKHSTPESATRCVLRGG